MTKKEEENMSEPNLSTTAWRSRPPRKWRVNADDSIVCPHHVDCTGGRCPAAVCTICLDANREIVVVAGSYFWAATEIEYAELATKAAALPEFIARAKPAEERTSAERVEVVHDRSNAADRIETALRRELETFADPLDRKLIIDALERRLAEVRKEMT